MSTSFPNLSHYSMASGPIEPIVPEKHQLAKEQGLNQEFDGHRLVISQGDWNVVNELIYACNRVS